MRRSPGVSLLSSLLSLLFVATPLSAQATVLKAARMLDVKSGAIVKNPIVVVSGERILAAGPDALVPANAKVIDLGDVTLLPGLIDAHTHLLQNYQGQLGGDDPNMVLTVTTLGTTKRALLGAAMGREVLEAGITSVRDLGNSGINGDIALRDAINSGWVVGPRIAASTRALAASGGQFGHLTKEVQALVDQEYAVISGVEEARKAVRNALYDGADEIKVIVNTDPRVVSLEEMKVIVEEAHREGRPVAAHAIGDQATRIAAEAGVNSIEHAYTIPDDVLKMMAAKGIFLVPTDYPDSVYLNMAPAPATPAIGQARLASIHGFTSGSRSRLKRAIAAGVKIAFGSDEYYQLPGLTRGQATLLSLRAYIEAGMSPLDVIRAATTGSAELLGWDKRVGSLTAGKFADIIAVPGNPLEDERLLERVSFVMKGGKVVRQ